MRILITGSNGFLGATLCRKLINRGETVRGLVRKSSDLSLLQGLTCQKITGSLEDVHSLEEALQGVELVFHAAAAVSDWGTLDYFRRVNVHGTKNLLEASIKSGVKRFVYIRSVAVHSFIGKEEMNEQSPQFATSFPYCQTKREAEALVLKYHQINDMDATIVRPGDIFGPGDRVSLLKMAKMLEAGRMGYIAKGKTLGAFTYVENLVDGLILAGYSNSAAGETFVITDGIKLTWREYFEKLTGALDLPKPRFSIHPLLAYSLAGTMEFFYRLFNVQSRPPLTRYLVDHLRNDFHFSIDKARNVLGYEPKVGIDEAIRRTAAWYKKVVRTNLK